MGYEALVNLTTHLLQAGRAGQSVGLTGAAHQRAVSTHQHDIHIGVIKQNLFNTVVECVRTRQAVAGDRQDILTQQTSMLIGQLEALGADGQGRRVGLMRVNHHRSIRSQSVAQGVHRVFRGRLERAASLTVVIHFAQVLGLHGGI